MNFSIIELSVLILFPFNICNFEGRVLSSIIQNNYKINNTSNSTNCCSEGLVINSKDQIVILYVIIILSGFICLKHCMPRTRVEEVILN